MRYLRNILLLVLILRITLETKMIKKYNLEYEALVVGGGPAGLAASINLARNGKKVLLVEKNGFLGGNLTLGLPILGFLDEFGNRCIAGFGEEFVQRLNSEGHSYYHRYCPKHNSVTNVDAEAVKFLAFRMCKEAGVDVILHMEVHNVCVKDRQIESVSFFGKCNELTVKAKEFIDCTGDGDLAFLSGCTFKKGRGEGHELMPPTVMCTLENVDVDKMLEYVEKHPEAMAAMSSTIDTKPGYDAAYFKADPNFVFVGMTDIFSRLRKEGKCPVDRGNMIAINGLHKGQMYLNTTRLLHVDATDIMDLTRAEIDGHLQNEKLVQTLRENVPGFENCYISSIAPNLGVRETRRFEGIYTLGVEEALSGTATPNSICLAGYKIHIHNNTENGTLFKTVKKPFGVPYGCLVSSEIDNLMFAGRCISVDESVIGSVRVMSTCMAMGQAAGLACSMALDKGIKPKDVDVPALRDHLVKDGAIVG